jgi:hypothetical protein
MHFSGTLCSRLQELGSNYNDRFLWFLSLSSFTVSHRVWNRARDILISWLLRLQLNLVSRRSPVWKRPLPVRYLKSDEEDFANVTAIHMKTEGMTTPETSCTSSNGRCPTLLSCNEPTVVTYSDGIMNVVLWKRQFLRRDFLENLCFILTERLNRFNAEKANIFVG